MHKFMGINFQTTLSTCEYPPPAAPPLIPKVGPCEGCLTQAKTFFLSCEPRAWLSPIVVVLLPSPRGVGVMPAVVERDCQC